MRARPEPLDRWHEVVESADPAVLHALISEDCVFRSPAVHSPQEGRVLTIGYLMAAMSVLGPTLRYRHEWWDERSAVLEFEAELDGLRRARRGHAPLGRGRTTHRVHRVRASRSRH